MIIFRKRSRYADLSWSICSKRIVVDLLVRNRDYCVGLLVREDVVVDEVLELVRKLCLVLFLV